MVALSLQIKALSKFRLLHPVTSLSTCCGRLSVNITETNSKREREREEESVSRIWGIHIYFYLVPWFTTDNRKIYSPLVNFRKKEKENVNPLISCFWMSTTATCEGWLLTALQVKLSSEVDILLGAAIQVPHIVVLYKTRIDRLRLLLPYVIKMGLFTQCYDRFSFLSFRVHSTCQCTLDKL